MDRRNEIREFLASRRARITPEQAGLIAYGRNRRVPGLRREEVAMLAGVSIDYYTQLERGNAGGVSAEVLEGIARALRLDEAERTHLFDLVRSTATARPQQPRAYGPGVRPSDPTFPNWDQDATAIADRYQDQEPGVVAGQLGEAADRIAGRFAGLTPDQWQRTGTRSDGARFTLDGFARYLMHDPVHHLHDITSGLDQ